MSSSIFSYYGGKKKIIDAYPSPTYDTIIEPFAGSAIYSLTYFYTKNIVLNDIYPTLFGIWNYLVEASHEQILNLPRLNLGDNLNDFDLTQEERDLMGFWVNRGVPYPHNVYTTWAFKSNEIERRRKDTLFYLNNIRHFVIKNKHYERLANVEATWFIDPPYQTGGEHYIHNEIDYSHLTNWVKTRKGQVIVCENAGADWLDFKPLVETRGQKKMSSELIWTND
jgi:site-specific DNA-adenine methylase